MSGDVPRNAEATSPFDLRASTPTRAKRGEDGNHEPKNEAKSLLLRPGVSRNWHLNTCAREGWQFKYAQGGYCLVTLKLSTLRSSRWRCADCNFTKFDRTKRYLPPVYSVFRNTVAVPKGWRLPIAGQRLGLRQPSAALRFRRYDGKAAEDCRGPKPCGILPPTSQNRPQFL